MSQIKVKFDSIEIRKRYSLSQSNDDEYSEEDEFKKRKRKSKKIKEIVETVFVWKKLINGMRTAEGDMVKFKPKESAQLIGLPIKTMYDYMYSLKYP